MKYASFVRFCLIMILVFQFQNNVVFAAGNNEKTKELSLKAAIQTAIKNSGDIRDAKADLTKKRTEWIQALYAVKNQELKDQGLFAKPHSLSKDLDIGMKISLASEALKEAKLVVTSQERKVSYDVEKLYLSAVQTMISQAAANQKWNDANQSRNGVRKKLTYGLASQEDLEDADKLLDKAKSELKVAELSYKAARISLGDKTGLDLESGYTFSFKPDYANLQQDMLWKYINGAEKSDLSLVKDVGARKIADEKVSYTRKLYVSKFSPARMSLIESMYRSQEMDFDVFMANYDETLDQIKQDWNGFLYLGFIPIPKAILQGEYDGISYFDDIRYSLPASMLDQKKAHLQENESKKNIIANVKQSFLAAKGAEEGYAQSLKQRDLVQDKLAAANKKNKLGLLKPDQLKQAADALQLANNQVFSSQIAYKTALSKLNLDSGGVVERTLKEGILPYKNIDDGLGPTNKPPKQAAALSGKWSLKSVVDPLISEFTIQVDKKLGATDYALFTTANKQIRRTVPAGKGIRYLSFVFSNPDDLKIKLYKKKILIAEATLEGIGSSGTLNIELKALKPGQPPEQAPDQPSDETTGQPNPSQSTKGKEFPDDTIIIGTYAIQMDALNSGNLAAAKATIEASGQGMLFKSELAGGTWVDVSNSVNVHAIAESAGDKGISAEKLNALSLTLRVDKPGEVAPLLTPSQLQEQLTALNKQLTQLKTDKAAAEAANKAVEMGQISVQVKDMEAQVRLLEALQSGDQKAASKQLGLINNPDALIRALQADSDAAQAAALAQAQAALAAQLQTAVAAGDQAAAAAITAQQQKLAAQLSDLQQQKAADPDALAAQAELSQAALTAALQPAAAGGQQAIDQAAVKLLADRLAVEANSSGSELAVAGLTAAKMKLAEQLKQALLQADQQQIDQLSSTAQKLDISLLAAEKMSLFAAKSAAEQLLAELAQQGQGSESVAQKLSDAIEEIKSKEKAKYSPDELMNAVDISREIRQTYGEAIIPIPVENVISADLDIKFTVPPVIIGGKAYIHIRPLSEAFGALVEWNEDNQTVTVSKGDVTVVCTINQSIAYVNGEPVELDTMPALVLHRTMIPLRFISEALGIQVEWNNSTQTLQLN